MYSAIKQNKKPKSAISRKREPASTAPFLKPFQIKSLSTTSGGSGKPSNSSYLSGTGQIVQTKLRIGAPNDKYEQEADAVANQVVSARSHALVARPPAIQRWDGKTGVQLLEEDESLSLQRKCADCGTEEDKSVQRKSPRGSELVAPPDFSSKLSGKSGRGEALPDTVRAKMESGFGRDFSDVSIHTDGEASQMSSAIGARAFTHGSDIYFKRGEYNPDSKQGQHLLAHELTHTVQQGGGKISPSREKVIQLKIKVNGSDYTPTDKYKKWIRKNYPADGEIMVAALDQLHNSGLPPVHVYDSLDRLGWELRLRGQRVGAAFELESGAISPSCCSYPGSGGGYNLDPAFWVKTDGLRFQLKPGSDPALAVKAIFAPSAGTVLECNSMMIALQYYSLLKTVGSKSFNQMFFGGKDLYIGVEHGSYPTGTLKHPVWDKQLFVKSYFNFTDANPHENLIVGDWLYFWNISDYSTHNPGGAWSGEWSMYLGDGRYTGFGVGVNSPSKGDSKGLTYNDLRKKLAAAYNSGYPGTPKKTYSNIPGFQEPGKPIGTGEVYRPDIKKILNLAPSEF